MATTRKRRPYAARVPVEQRRAQLLDAALRVVVDQGHGAATMDAVAEAAGVTKPVVYNVFANRGELLGALLRREQQGALAQVAEAFPAELPGGVAATELLSRVLRAYLEAVRAEPYRWRCILVSVDEAPHEMHAAIAAAREWLGKRVRALLELLFDWEGTDPLDLDLAVHALIALAETSGRLLLTDPDRYEPDRFVAAAESLVRRMSGRQ